MGCVNSKAESSVAQHNEILPKHQANNDLGHDAEQAVPEPADDDIAAPLPPRKSVHRARRGSV